MSSGGKDIAANCPSGRITFGALFSLYLMAAFFTSLPNVISSHKSPSVHTLSRVNADIRGGIAVVSDDVIWQKQPKNTSPFPAWLRPHTPDLLAEMPPQTEQTELAALAQGEAVRVKAKAKQVGSVSLPSGDTVLPPLATHSAKRTFSLLRRSKVVPAANDPLERPQVRAPQIVAALSRPPVSDRKVLKAAHCEAGDIAGWSNEDLLPEHKAILKARETAANSAVSDLEMRLAARGFQPGAPIYMQIFKDSSTLEVWLKKGDRYALFNRYQICRWSGSLGPKLYEGDKQSPEGYYLVDRQLFNRPSYKWKSSFSIGYPNAYDKQLGRTGSLILVHGGCTSTGCFAMTDPVIDEVRELAEQARENGQSKFHVNVYPFPLTEKNLSRHSASPWLSFWRNLKVGYDLFKAQRVPPKVRVCDKRYVFAPGDADREDENPFGEQCLKLTENVPGWQPSPRSGALNNYHYATSRFRPARARLRCNPARASCRKWYAMNHRKRQHVTRRAVRKHARTIGRRQK